MIVVFMATRQRKADLSDSSFSLYRYSSLVESGCFYVVCLFVCLFCFLGGAGFTHVFFPSLLSLLSVGSLLLLLSINQVLRSRLYIYEVIIQGLVASDRYFLFPPSI